MKRMTGAVLLSLAVLSAYSIDDKKLKENIGQSRHLTELMVDEEYAKRQKALAEERRAKIEQETERTDEILGIKYHLEPYHVLSAGSLKLEFFGKTGTFNIFSISPSKKETPLLSESDLFSSSGFLVKLDGEVFDCMRSNRVKKELRRLDKGAQLLFRLDKRVRIVVDFSILQSKKDAPEDIVKIVVYSINEDRFEHYVDVRALFDTVCGETSSVHFITDLNSRIRNETRFSQENMHKERSIVSSNGYTSFQFVLDGISVSPVQSVTMGNIDELHRMDWDTGFRKGRGFSNIRGYDDSGIMIDWPDDVIAPGQKTSSVFYIAAATNEEDPRGLYFADNLPPPEENPKENDGESSEALGDAKKSENSAGKAEKRATVEFIVPPIKDYQLDPEYIQQLIDKIDSLQSSKNVNKNEVMRLNAELDAILEKLRRQ